MPQSGCSVPSAAVAVPACAVFAALVCAAVVPFWGSLRGDFLYDDWNIVSNPVVTGAVPAVDAFTTDFWGLQLASRFSHKSYRPLAILSFRWTAAWFGVDDPLPYHVVCVALHAVNTLLVAAASRVLLPSRASAVFAAAVFAVHPLHCETVRHAVLVVAHALCRYVSLGVPVSVCLSVC